MQELTVFNVDFPTETTDVKFRAIQWICTEVLLALAALLNFMPRMSTARLLGPLLIPSSQVLPMGILPVFGSRHAGLFPECHMASDWNRQYLGIQVCRGGIHVDL